MGKKPRSRLPDPIADIHPQPEIPIDGGENANVVADESDVKEGDATPLAGDWPPPDVSLIEDRRGELPEFPPDVFSPRLSGWLSRASRGAGTRIDHIAVPLIGVASSLIGKARRVEASSSWIEPVTLWTCIVAPSGDRKTPGLKAILRTLDHIEKENAPTHEAAHLAHATRKGKAKEILKRWKQDCAKALKDKTEPKPMPVEAIEPGDFIWPSIYVTDATVPRLAKLLVVRPRGMLQVRDELSGLFASIRQQAGGRGFYLEAWNGERYVVERVDDDRSVTVENLLVGIVGGFQPDKLARAFAGDEDGMYGRFLFGWPATPDYAPLTDAIAEVDAGFQDLLTKLIRLPAEDENKEVFVPRVVPLSAGARAQFEEYRKFVDQTKRGTDGREQQWLAKSETQVLRLAGTLAYLAWADGPVSTSGLEGITASLEPTEIAERFMVDAVSLMQKYFWPHARAALRQIGLTDRHRNIRRALRWIRANDREEISVRDIRRDALAGSVDVEQTRDMLARMVTTGWLRTKGPEQTGGRPRERWKVNPALLDPIRLEKLLEPEVAGTAETAESAKSKPFGSSGTFGKVAFRR